MIRFGGILNRRFSHINSNVVVHCRNYATKDLKSDKFLNEGKTTRRRVKKNDGNPFMNGYNESNFETGEGYSSKTEFQKEWGIHRSAIMKNLLVIGALVGFLTYRYFSTYKDVKQIQKEKNVNLEDDNINFDFLEEEVRKEKMKKSDE